MPWSAWNACRRRSPAGSITSPQTGGWKNASPSAWKKSAAASARSLLRIQLQIDHRIFPAVEDGKRLGGAASAFKRGRQLIIDVRAQSVEVVVPLLLRVEGTDLFGLGVLQLHHGADHRLVVAGSHFARHAAGGRPLFLLCQTGRSQRQEDRQQNHPFSVHLIPLSIGAIGTRRSATRAAATSSPRRTLPLRRPGSFLRPRRLPPVLRLIPAPKDWCRPLAGRPRTRHN